MKELARVIKNLIKGGGASVLLSTVIVKFVSFFPSVFLARMLSKSDMAAVSYADNILAYIMSFGGLGVTSSLIRYCNGQKGQEKDQEYFRYALKCGCISTFVVIIGCGMFYSHYNFAFQNAKFILYALLLSAVLQHIFDALIMFIRTRLKYTLYSGVNVVFSVLKLLCIILFTYLWDLSGMIWARYISIIIVILYMVKEIKKEWKIGKAATLVRDEKVDFIKFSVISLISSAFSTMMPLNETFLVNNLVKEADMVANYKVAMTIPYNLIIISGALLIYFGPIFAKREKDKGWVRKNTLILGGIIGGVYIVIILLMFLSSKLIVSIVYGNKYMDVVPVMNMLTVAYGINAGFRMIPMNILYVIGKVRFNAINTIIACVAQFVLDYWFISRYGIHGVAYASCIVYLLSGLAFWLYLFKITDVRKE